MELITTNQSIKYQHCFLRLTVKQSALMSHDTQELALEEILGAFNAQMRA